MNESRMAWCTKLGLGELPSPVEHAPGGFHRRLHECVTEVHEQLFGYCRIAPYHVLKVQLRGEIGLLTKHSIDHALDGAAAVGQQEQALARRGLHDRRVLIDGRTIAARVALDLDPRVHELARR